MTIHTLLLILEHFATNLAINFASCTPQHPPSPLDPCLQINGGFTIFVSRITVACHLDTKTFQVWVLFRSGNQYFPRLGNNNMNICCRLHRRGGVLHDVYKCIHPGLRKNYFFILSIQICVLYFKSLDSLSGTIKLI